MLSTLSTDIKYFIFFFLEVGCLKELLTHKFHKSKGNVTACQITVGLVSDGGVKGTFEKNAFILLNSLMTDHTIYKRLYLEKLHCMELFVTTGISEHNSHVICSCEQSSCLESTITFLVISPEHELRYKNKC